MKLYFDIDKTTNNKKPGILSIGYFDSFHLGHKKIINDLINYSKANELASYVLTYKNLPIKDNDNRRILEFDYKLKLLKESGIENIIVCEYNEEFSKIQPDDFVKKLVNNYKISDFVVGKDFAFGNGKKGNYKDLIENNCKVHIIEPLCKDGKQISTSLIKENIFKGDLETANSLIGRNYFIEGIVKKGKQLGRTIGFPTMNINNDSIIYPLDGTYVTKTYINGKEYYSMTYVDKSIIETNLIGFNEFKYNFKIKIDFFKKIRDNVDFTGIENLKKLLEKDFIFMADYFNLNNKKEK